jgi:hypothetical protein
MFLSVIHPETHNVNYCKWKAVASRANRNALLMLVHFNPSSSTGVAVRKQFYLDAPFLHVFMFTHLLVTVTWCLLSTKSLIAPLLLC